MKISFLVFLFSISTLAFAQRVGDYVRIDGLATSTLNGLFGKVIKVFPDSERIGIQIPAINDSKSIKKTNLQVVNTFWVRNAISNQDEQWYVIEQSKITDFWWIVQKENGIKTPKEPNYLLKTDAFRHPQFIGEQMMDFQKNLTAQEQRHFAQLISFGPITKIQSDFERYSVGAAITIVQLVKGKRLSEYYADGANGQYPQIRESAFVAPIIDGFVSCLKILNDHGYTHEDINPKQFVLDLETMVPVLVDFKGLKNYQALPDGISNCIRYVLQPTNPLCEIDNDPITLIRAMQDMTFKTRWHQFEAFQAETKQRISHIYNEKLDMDFL